MKRNYFLVILVIVVILAVVFVILRVKEDTWIKDSRGIWIKHGNPSETPNYILEQQVIINCALGKFDDFTGEIDSQCLGTCGDYAVDIVHIPRTAEDNLAENQCADFRNGKVSHFIELDKERNIVRIV